MKWSCGIEGLARQPVSSVRARSSSYRRPPLLLEPGRHDHLRRGGGAKTASRCRAARKAPCTAALAAQKSPWIAGGGQVGLHPALRPQEVVVDDFVGALPNLGAVGGRELGDPPVHPLAHRLTGVRDVQAARDRVPGALLHVRVALAGGLEGLQAQPAEVRLAPGARDGRAGLPVVTILPQPPGHLSTPICWSAASTAFDGSAARTTRDRAWASRASQYCRNWPGLRRCRKDCSDSSMSLPACSRPSRSTAVPSPTVSATSSPAHP